MDEKKDLRIIKTKKALFTALFTLLEQKSFDKIKISDICEVALINRSTFYAHYEDKYDLLISFVEEFKNTILIDFNNKNEYISKEYFMELLKTLIDHIDEHREIYSSIVMHNRNGLLIDFLIDVANRDIAQRFKDDHNMIKSNIPIDTITRFYLGGIVNVGVDWIANKDKYTKEQILEYLDKLIPDKI